MEFGQRFILKWTVTFPLTKKVLALPCILNWVLKHCTVAVNVIIRDIHSHFKRLEKKRARNKCNIRKHSASLDGHAWMCVFAWVNGVEGEGRGWVGVLSTFQVWQKVRR